VIDKDNWSEAVAAGWRLYEHCPADDTDANVLLVAAAVQQHGSDNVMIGVAFDLTAPALASECIGFAIYIKDGDQIIAELYEDLLNYDCGHEMDEMDGLKA
jgi:hypothetical protein